MSRERSPPSGHAKIVLAAVVFGVRRAASGIFEDQDAAIAERDFFGLPDGALVERVVL